MPTLNPVLTGGNGTPTYNLGIAETYSWIPVQNDQNRPMYARAVYPLGTTFGKTAKDVIGNLKVSQAQNIYEANFEYSSQPLRWESLNIGAGSISHVPGMGAVKMQILSGNDVNVRQSRPYHRYQPGKSMYMASAVNFGGPYIGQFQRVGFFDDANGMFIEQGTPGSSYNTGANYVSNGTLTAITTAAASSNPNGTTGINQSLSANNPSGMYICWRTDSNPYAVNGNASTAVYTDYKISLDQWSDPYKIAGTLNWNDLQMIWMEYSWYGAGTLRWGVLINGEPYILHEQGMGNFQPYAWARTGNLPVRYEQRDTTGINQPSTMLHYGVSVIVDGLLDPQRGFTYSYGTSAIMPIAGGANRKPLVSLRPRQMGTVEYTQSNSSIVSSPAPTVSSLSVAGTPWATNQWVGRSILFPNLSSSVNPYGVNAKITSNTSNSLTFGDVVTLSSLSSAFVPYAGANYTIGQIDRGQIIPLDLLITSNNSALIELIASTPTSPVQLTGANFVSLSSLGSTYSFGERDIAATALAGGEVVYGFFTPTAGTVQDINLSNFFPLYNTIKGNTPDILTVAITTNTPVSAGVHVVGQETMS